MLRTNEKNLAKLSVVGEIVSPQPVSGLYSISPEGIPSILPGVGGITYNVRVGDSACNWQADHVEPGVSLENKEGDSRYGRGANTAFNILSCVGNEGKVITGDAKGATGVVTGKHGGVDHVLMDFPQEILEKLVIGDKVQVKAFGLGLKLLDFPQIAAVNSDPRFLKALNPKPKHDKLEIPVTHMVPEAIMGAGMGMSQVYSGDCDIQLFDQKVRKQYNLDTLRLGDLIAILDADHSYGRLFRQGAVSIGIVVHTNAISAGHGPGVTTLFTSASGKIILKIDEKANIAKFLKLRAYI
jgi:hypothetical protein